MASSSMYDDLREIRLVLIGKTGVGKSSLGNTILGRKEFESKLSAYSVTQRTIFKEVTYGATKIRIVDTPGLFDTGDFVKKEEEWLNKEILKSTILSVPGPHAFLYVLQFGRLSEEDIQTANKLLNQFGENIYDYVIIVFTHAQELIDEGIEIKEYIKRQSEIFAQLCRKCNNRILWVENKYSTTEEKQGFIDDLLRVIHQMGTHHYYKNKTIEDATRSFYEKVEEVQNKSKVSYEQATKMVQEESTCCII